MSKPTIVFMGTPEFAVYSLDILTAYEYPVIGVITQPDRPKGRGQALTPSPVKVFAEQRHLTVFQPDKVRNAEFLSLFRELSPDLVVVAAFGQILPREILEGPKMGCINVHPSLLPEYRGAAPINWSLIRGAEKTGVTIMRMDEGMDTGDILIQEETMIETDESYGMLHDHLAKMGAELLIKTIDMMQQGLCQRTPQNNSLATYAPRLKKEDGLIRWDSDIHSIVDLIRGLSPTPCAYTFFKGKKLKIFSATGKAGPVEVNAGKLHQETDKGLSVAAKNGWVYLKDVQLESKKRMSIQDFLRGSIISPEDTVG